MKYKIHLTYDPEDIMAHKEFIKHGFVKGFKNILSDRRKRATLVFPGKRQQHIDVIV